MCVLVCENEVSAILLDVQIVNAVNVENGGRVLLLAVPEFDIAKEDFGRRFRQITTPVAENDGVAARTQHVELRDHALICITISCNWPAHLIELTMDVIAVDAQRMKNLFRSKSWSIIVIIEQD